ncbi:MAG TPA: aspartate carbamoyltransferase [Phycisphaerae bacterium]|nr:aspartate carbamoyltransferase [Phycisphaerae bacterium]HNU45332.1 aspartate carbamoyltransferase [Phycisphaerae bacterium]
MITQTVKPAAGDTAARIAALNRGDRVFHVVLAQQFDRERIEQLCRLAEMVRRVAATRHGTQFLNTLLSYRRAMLYFIQPSTRTFLSFTAACQVLGMPYNSVRERSTSSEIKGESEDDTVRVLSQYFHLIIIRHPAEGMAERTAHLLNEMPRTIPVINGGSGKDQHPTQALLDVYTLFRCFAPQRDEHVDPEYGGNPFAGRTVAFVGDLQRGRTVRSLAYLLCRYPGVRLLFISPPQLQIGDDILEYVRRHDIEYELGDDLRARVGDCDAIYMTRLQDEWDVAGESKSIDYNRYALTWDMAKDFKPDLAILHPLPRRHELDQRLDALPQAKYWEQVRNGMWMRAALIAFIFNVDNAIRDHFHSYYAY